MPHWEKSYNLLTLELQNPKSELTGKTIFKPTKIIKLEPAARLPKSLPVQDIEAKLLLPARVTETVNQDIRHMLTEKEMEYYSLYACITQD